MATRVNIMMLLFISPHFV